MPVRGERAPEARGKRAWPRRRSIAAGLRFDRMQPPLQRREDISDANPFRRTGSGGQVQPGDRGKPKKPMIVIMS